MMPSSGRPASRKARTRWAASSSASVSVWLVGTGIGDAERRGGALEQIEVDAGELGDLARRVAGAVAGQRALDR